MWYNKRILSHIVPTCFPSLSYKYDHETGMELYSMSYKIEKALNLTWWTLQKPRGEYFYVVFFYLKDLTPWGSSSRDKNSLRRYLSQSSCSSWGRLLPAVTDRHSHSASRVGPLSEWLKLSWCWFYSLVPVKSWHSAVYDNAERVSM